VPPSTTLFKHQINFSEKFQKEGEFGSCNDSMVKTKPRKSEDTFDETDKLERQQQKKRQKKELSIKDSER
jgi:hypothetical protein